VQRLECVAGKIKAGVHDPPTPSNHQRQWALIPYSAGLPAYRTTVS
jgi:hypothetical protein